MPNVAPRTRRESLLFFVAICAILQLALFSFFGLRILRVAVFTPDLGHWLHYGFFIGALLLGIALLVDSLSALLLKFVGARSAVATATFFETLIFVFLAVDCSLFVFVGTHFHEPVILPTLLDPKMVAKDVGLNVYVFLLVCFSICAAVFLIHYALFLAIEKRIIPLRASDRRTHVRLATYFIFFGSISWFLETFLDTWSGVYKAYPLFSLLPAFLTPGVSTGVHLRPQYPAFQESPQIQLKKKPDIFLIMADSLRADRFNKEDTPNLYQLARENSCLRSERHFSGGHITPQGVFSWLTGLSAFHLRPFRDAGIPSLPLQVLKAQGYETITLFGSTMSNERIPALGQFETYKQDLGADSAAGDREMLNYLLKLKATHPRPRFVFAMFYALHYPYLFPDSITVPQDTRAFEDASRAESWLRYRRSIRYFDSLMGELRSAYRDEIAAGDLVLAVSGDHGEEFWEHGVTGHLAFSFYNENVQVPLILCLPGVEKNFSVPLSSHADVFPTIFDALAQENRVPFTEFFDGMSLLRPLPTDRQVVVASLGYPDRSTNVCVIRGDRKTWLKRGFPWEKLNVERETDLDDRPIRGPNSENVGKLLDGSLMRFLKRVKD